MKKSSRRLADKIPPSERRVAAAAEETLGANSLDAAERTLRALIDRCRPGLGSVVIIHFTNNSCTMVSKYERGGVPHLRVHHLFRRAPRALLRDLVRFCFLRVTRKTGRRIRGELMDFIEEYREETLLIYPERRRRPPAGDHYDLIELMGTAWRKHVPELTTTPEIAWTREAHRTLMGKWLPTPTPHPNLIVINRLLDHSSVPRYYVEFVVFHELLHELMPTSRQCGRWVHHPPEFRRRERQFPGFRQAQRWEEANLSQLYRTFRRARGAET